MSKHKPPTNRELAAWEGYGSYAGHDAVQRMIVEIHNVRDCNAKLNKQLDAFIAASSLPEPTRGREGRMLRLKTENTDLRNINDGLVATVVGLREALKEYGSHNHFCAFYNLLKNKDGYFVRSDCDCGLDREINT